MNMSFPKFQISTQYLKKSQIKVTILDVLNPGHFVVRESASTDASTEAKRFIEAEDAMQKYYQSLDPGFYKLPLKDTIIVVLYKSKFYRAKVISILNMSAGHLFKVYLVDYGAECSIDRSCIYEIEKDFLMHPFQAVDFKLLGLEPISLVMDNLSLNISYGPVSYWDDSCKIFVADFQKGICNAYIEVQAVDREHIFGKLFICHKDNITKCLNEELISREYVRYNEELAGKVQSIEKFLETGEINVEKSVTDETYSDIESNPEQMSSPSKTEPDLFGFKMRFVRPSDGKIISESILTKECPKVEEDLFDEVRNTLDSKTVPDSKFEQKTLSPSGAIQKTPSPKVTNTFDSKTVPDSKCEHKALSPSEAIQKTPSPKVSYESISPLSASESLSGDQSVIMQKRFLKLRKIYGNKLKSSTPLTLNNEDCAVSEHVTSVAEKATEKFTDNTEHSPNKPFDKDCEKNIIISPTKLNYSIVDSDHSRLCDVGEKLNVPNEVKGKSVEICPSQNATQSEILAQKRLLKLQQLHRKKLLSHKQFNISSTSVENTPVNTHTQVPSVSSSPENPCNSSNLPCVDQNEEVTSNRIETNLSCNSKNSSCSSSLSNISTMSEESFKTTGEIMTKEQSYMLKRFLKVQQLYRKKSESSFSHKDGDSSNIPNSNSMSEAIRPKSPLDSSINLVESSESSSINNSVPNNHGCIPAVSNTCAQKPSEVTSMSNNCIPQQASAENSLRYSDTLGQTISSSQQSSEKVG